MSPAVLRSRCFLLTNLGNYRQVAKFAKVDLLIRRPQFPWRLGGELLEVPCLATPGLTGFWSEVGGRRSEVGAGVKR